MLSYNCIWYDYVRIDDVFLCLHNKYVAIYLSEYYADKIFYIKCLYFLFQHPPLPLCPLYLSPAPRSPSTCPSLFSRGIATAPPPLSPWPGRPPQGEVPRGALRGSTTMTSADCRGRHPSKTFQGNCWLLHPRLRPACEWAVLRSFFVYLWMCSICYFVSFGPRIKTGILRIKLYVPQLTQYSNQLNCGALLRLTLKGSLLRIYSFVIFLVLQMNWKQTDNCSYYFYSKLSN